MPYNQNFPVRRDMPSPEYYERIILHNIWRKRIRRRLLRMGIGFMVMSVSVLSLMLFFWW